MIVALLVHITCIFAYQLPVLQNTINCDKLWTRSVHYLNSFYGHLTSPNAEFLKIFN